MTLRAQDYLNKLASIVYNFPQHEVVELAAFLQEFMDRDALLMFTGNGGSAATAAHWVADIQKTIIGKRYWAKGARAICLTDNTPLLTAWSNDEAYTDAMMRQVNNVGRPGDLLIVISASGNSENIVNAVNHALAHEMSVLAFLGFDGGTVLQTIEHHNKTNSRVLNSKAMAVIIKSDSYGIVEDMHSILMHSIIEELKVTANGE